MGCVGLDNLKGSSYKAQATWRLGELVAQVVWCEGLRRIQVSVQIPGVTLCKSFSLSVPQFLACKTLVLILPFLCFLLVCLPCLLKITDKGNITNWKLVFGLLLPLGSSANLTLKPKTFQEKGLFLTVCLFSLWWCRFWVVDTNAQMMKKK